MLKSNHFQSFQHQRDHEPIIIHHS